MVDGRGIEPPARSFGDTCRNRAPPTMLPSSRAFCISTHNNCITVQEHKALWIADWTESPIRNISETKKYYTYVLQLLTRRKCLVVIYAK